MRGVSLVFTALTLAPALMLCGCGDAPQILAQAPKSIEVEWPTNSSAGARAKDIGDRYCADKGGQAYAVMEEWQNEKNIARFECR